MISHNVICLKSLFQHMPHCVFLFLCSSVFACYHIFSNEDTFLASLPSSRFLVVNTDVAVRYVAVLSGFSHSLLAVQIVFFLKLAYPSMPYYFITFSGFFIQWYHQQASAIFQDNGEIVLFGTHIYFSSLCLIKLTTNQ